VVLAAKDFGCLPGEIGENLTDEQFHVWLELREEEARQAEKHAR
jgi:hypothetical protein